jgi:hypothetical protein
LASLAFSNEDSQAGRNIVTKWKDAVVTVQIVLKTGMSYEGQESAAREGKVEVTGTVVDPQGLVVVSLTAVNPDEVYRRMAGPGPSRVDITTEVVSVRIITADGQELPGKMVLRDRDLDLAFIRPMKKPEKPLTYVDLTKGAKPDLLDSMLILCRLGPEAGRGISATFDHVHCIIDKPQTYYLPGLPAVASSLGAPVFAMDTSVVGLLLLRVVPSALSSTTRAGSLLPPGLMYVILPAPAILDAVRQAVE